MVRRPAVALLIAALIAAAGAGYAADRPPGKTLVVGTKAAPPFSVPGKDGSWSGISIELWDEITGELGLEYEYRPFELKGLLSAVETGSVDVAVAALTITAERERLFDFSHPFHTSGLGIAVASGRTAGWAKGLAGLLSAPFLQAVGALVLLLLAVGLLMWLIERRRNPTQFGGSTAQGLGAGFWWSAVTMTTVGYGDKAPVTLWGRLLGLVWMFAGIIMISGFTAAIASSLTVTRLGPKVRGPEDLQRVRVVSVPSSSSEAYLQRNRVEFRGVDSADEGLRQVATGAADAFVYDAPILRHAVNEQYRGRLEVLPKTIERQDYGFAFPAGSPLRESVNRVLLERIRRPEWQETLRRHLGE